MKLAPSLNRIVTDDNSGRAPESPLSRLSEYELRNLPVHLDVIGDHENLFRLLDLETPEGKNAWFLAKSTLDTSASSYTEDQKLAWAVAERIDTHAARADWEAELLAREVQCILAIASVTSLMTNIPPELLAALVAEGQWDPNHALSAALQTANARQRAEVLAKLAPHLVGQDVERALQGLRSGDRYSEYCQRNALAALALRLSAEHIESAWATAEAFAHDMPIGFAVAALGPCLPADRLERTLELLHESTGTAMDNEPLRASGLAEIVQYLPMGMLSAARAAAETLRATSAERDFALAAIVRRRAQLGDATAAAKEAAEIGDHYWRAIALVGAAEHTLCATAVWRILRTARDEARRIGADGFRQAEILVAVCEAAARRSPRQRWARRICKEACDAVLRLPFGREKTSLSLRLVPYLEPAQRGELLDRIRVVLIRSKIASIAKLYSFAKLNLDLEPATLRQFLPHLRERDFGEAGEHPEDAEIYSETWEEERELALCYAQAGDFETAFTLADGIEHELVRVGTWVELLLQIPLDARLDAAADLLHYVQEPGSYSRLFDPARTSALLAVVSLLPTDERRRVLLRELHRIWRIGDEEHCKTAVTALATGEDAKSQHAPDSFGDTDDSGVVFVASDSLGAPTAFESMVSPGGSDPGGEVTPGWEVPSEPASTVSLRALLDAQMRLMIYPLPTDENALLRVAATLPGSLVDEACELARGFKDFNENICNRSQALSALSVRLAQLGRENTARSIAREIEQLGVQALTLGTIARQLPPDERVALEDEALTVAEAIDDADARSQILIDLAYHLQGPGKDHALHAAHSAVDKMDNAPQRARRLWRLALLLPEQERNTTLEAALSVAATLPDFYRPSALIDIANDLPPSLLAMAVAAADAIDNPAEREKALVRLLPQFAERSDPALALSFVPHIPSEERRAHVLAAITPHFEVGVPKQALDIIEEIDNDDAKAVALAGVAPFLDEEQLAHACRLASGLGYVRGRIVALRGLAPRLTQEPRSTAYRHLQQMLHTLAQHIRADVLDEIVALIPLIARLAGEQGIADTRQAVEAVGRWWP
jgi:hypothetical protein